MLTVKEFKDFGVAFTIDDKIDFYDGCAGAISQVCADDINSKPYCYGGEVFYFAWRPLNTLPDNPKFKFEYNTGSIRVQWRPLLDQSKQSAYDVDSHVSGERIGVMSNGDEVELVAANDDKPVFTQAMADGGEKVKVGMLFATAAGDYTALLVNNSHVVFEHERLGFVIEDHAFVHPIDTRTPKQKAVDEMIKSLETFENEFVQLNKYEAGKLYDAGYRKC